MTENEYNVLHELVNSDHTKAIMESFDIERDEIEAIIANARQKLGLQPE